MKRKGVNLLEQHAEKVVVAVFAAAGLAVVAMQFVQPTTVRVDKDVLSPEKAFEKIARQAQDLEGKLKQTEPPPQVAEATVRDVARELEERMRKGSAPAGRLAVSLGRPALPVIGESEGRRGGQAAQYAAVAPPAPSKPAVATFAAAIDPAFVAATPGMDRLVPPEQPYDLRVVTVQAVFPADQMVAMLQADPDGDGPLQPIPRLWWLDRLEALDVQLERQEIKADGTLGEPVLAPSPPGLGSLRERIAGGAAFADIARAATDQRTAVLRPPFFPTVAGEAWRPPDSGVVGVSGKEALEITARRRELEDLNRRLKNIDAQIAKPPAPPANRPGAPAGGGGLRGSAAPSGSSPGSGPAVAQSGRPGGGGGGVRPGAPPPGTGQSSAPTDNKNELKAQKDRLEKRREEITKWLAENDPSQKKDRGSAPIPAATRALSAGEPVVIWAHDASAKPDTSYRYRVRVVVTNPLFGNERLMDEASRGMAKEPAIAGAFSEWSEPVRVDGDTRVFFTSASTDSAGSLAENLGASAEICRFYYGFWRREKVSLRPGDAVAARVALPAWPLFDSESKESGTAADALNVDVGAFLVDVTQTPAEQAGQQRLQVTYRDREGALITVNPDRERESAARAEVERSTAAAKDARPAPPKKVDAQAGAPGGPAGRPASRDGTSSSPSGGQQPRQGASGRDTGG